MEKSWQVKKLGEICDIKTGKKDVNQGNPHGKYPFFTCAKEHTFSDGYSFDTEALLVAGNGDVGSVSYYKGKFEAYQRTYVLSNFSGILPRLLYLYLDGFLKEAVSKQKLGNTMPYIKLGMLTEFEIPVPPLAEQKKIAKKLDEVFEGVAKARELAEKNLKNSRELFESYLQSIFTDPGKDWEENNMGEFATLQYGYTGKAKKEGLYRYIRISDTRKDGLVKEKNKVYLDDFNSSDNYILNNEDLLTARIGASAGKVLFFTEDEKSIFASYLIRIHFNNKFENKFYWYFSKTRFYWDQVRQLSAGAAQPQFNGNALKHILFLHPKSLSEQKAIVKKLDALSTETKKLEAIYKQKLADLEELKKSILKQAFAGEL